jgi:hypothetical protein
MEGCVFLWTLEIVAKVFFGDKKNEDFLKKRKNFFKILSSCRYIRDLGIPREDLSIRSLFWNKHELLFNGDKTYACDK